MILYIAQDTIYYFISIRCTYVVVVQSLSRVPLFATPRTVALQASLTFTISWSLLRLMAIESVMPFNHFNLCHPPSPPALSLSQHQSHFQWVSSLHQVDKVLKLQLRHESFQWIFRVDFLLDWLDWLCCPQDSQESSPAPQFKSISSLALSFVYGPTLRSVHDYWKNSSFDYTDLCWQSNVCFLICCLGLL